jgi:hypothetical protein
MRRRALVIVAMAIGCGAPQRPRTRVEVAYRIRCTPRDARVIVDEVDQGQCVLWENEYLGLGGGTHRLRVERDGYLPVEREMPTTGRRETLTIVLRERPE